MCMNVKDIFVGNITEMLLWETALNFTITAYLEFIFFFYGVYSDYFTFYILIIYDFSYVVVITVQSARRASIPRLINHYVMS